jgi:hypothetical protein
MAVEKPDGSSPEESLRFKQTFVISCSRIECRRSRRTPYYTDLPPIAHLNANGMPAFVDFRAGVLRNRGPSRVSPLDHLLAKIDALVLSEKSRLQAQPYEKVRGAESTPAPARPRFAAAAIVVVLSVGLAGLTLLSWPDENLHPDHSQPAGQVARVAAPSRSNSPPPISRSEPRRASASRSAHPSDHAKTSPDPAIRSNVTPADRAIAIMAVSPNGNSGEVVDPYAGQVAKPLTGEGLELALMADRIATKERNLQQLDLLRRASEDRTENE